MFSTDIYCGHTFDRSGIEPILGYTDISLWTDKPKDKPKIDQGLILVNYCFLKIKILQYDRFEEGILTQYIVSLLQRQFVTV